MSVNMQIIKNKKNRGTEIQNRLQKVYMAEYALITLYVNQKPNSRVKFTKKEKVLSKKHTLAPEMTDDFFAKLLSDFSALAKRLGFKAHVVVGDIASANVELAKEKVEVILAQAHDRHGNTLHMCYNVI